MNYPSLLVVFLLSALLSSCSSNPEKKPAPRKSAEPQAVRKTGEEPVKKPDSPKPDSTLAAEQALKEGIRSYDEGRYAEAGAYLRGAVNVGALSAGSQVTARKYLAFIYCTSGDKAACRAEFKKIFGLNPQFRLSASEAGHPAWEPVYREELAAARVRK